MAARTKAKKATTIVKNSKGGSVKAKPVTVKVVEEKKKPKLGNRAKFLLVLLVLALGYLLYVSKGLFVAATVNGTPVSRLSVVKELEKQGGQQVLESLVNEILIEQEAKKVGIEVTAEELDAKVAEFTEQVTAQGQEIDALLAAQGMTQEDFRSQIKIQIYIEKLMEDSVTVTDEELKSFIDTNKEFLPEGMSEEELNDFARDELKQQKLSGEFTTWLAEKKEAADINFFVEY